MSRLSPHAMDCGLCCGLAKCDCGVDQPTEGAKDGNEETREEDAAQADARKEGLLSDFRYANTDKIDGDAG